MDPRTGRIYFERNFEGLKEEIRKRLIFFTNPPTKQQMVRRPPKVGRNEPCPCGSGKKFKKCCYLK